MRKSIHVYIEGEGGRHGDPAFRQSWRTFLDPLVGFARTKGIVAFQCIQGGGGARTLNSFLKPLPQQAGGLRILILDSERAVSTVARPWTELGIAKPGWADDRNFYLIIQCLETWLLADVDLLKNHYNRPKPCFNERKIAAWPNLEAVPKATVQSAIAAATAACARPYTHADGNILIAKADHKKLSKLKSVDRLFTDFKKKIDEYAAA